MSSLCRRVAVVCGWLALFSSGATAEAVVEDPVSFLTHDGYSIECLLSYPDSQSERFPGLLLLPGSGLHDADFTVEEPRLNVTRGRQKLFRPLARYVSRSGWAVLRCNKRGASFGHRRDRPELLDSSTLSDLVDDARRALTLLQTHPRVLASPLVVYGHSEGALLAARLALDASPVDLLVLVGCPARSFADLIQHQFVDRNLEFFRQAADLDRDGSLTLAEMALLDGNFGLGSMFVFNSSDTLFDAERPASGEILVQGLAARTDANGDGQLDIESEITPGLQRRVDRLLSLAADGSLGRYWQSLVEAPPLSSYIHRLDTPILFVHGELDLQVPLEDPLSLMANLEAAGKSAYDLLVVPAAGHSLSPPNDTFADDGGLTLLDNLTFNAAGARVHRRLLAAIEENIDR